MAKRGNFFIRLCYGYVGRYKDTSKMTTKEVVEEFLKRKGVSSPKEFFNAKFSGIRQSGATSGALDSNSRRARKHAKLYYKTIRNNKYDVEKIAKNTGFNVEDIRRIKNYVFFQEHNFRNAPKGRFVPDYDMALSWQRLEQGKDIWEVDIILLKHELYEMEIESKYLYYEDAHNETEKYYNYALAIKREKEKRNGKRKKHKD